MAIQGVLGETIELYNQFISILPSYAGAFFNFLVLVLLIVIYAIFIWKAYKFVARKDFLGLNLNQYNKGSHPTLKAVLYFLEYIVISPILIFLMFVVFTFLLILLSQNPETSQLLIISATVIAAIRITSYYRQGASEEIAKFLPLTLLALSVLNPNSFAQAQYLERTLTHLTLIPSLYKEIFYYLGFIILLEVILRFFDFIFSLFHLQEPETEKQD